jgi:hypothetical protein
VWEAVGDRPCESGPLAEQPGQLEHPVDVVHRSSRAEHRVVELVDLRELPLPRGGVALRARAARLFLGPTREALGGDPRGLEGVDPVDDTGEQTSGITADLMSAQGQLVDAVEQHCEALGGAQRLEERVDLRFGRVLAEQPGRGHRVGVDDQLLVAGLDVRLRPRPDPPRRGHRARQDQRPLALADESGEPARESLGPPAAGDPGHKKHAVAVFDGRLLPLVQPQGSVIALVSHTKSG